MTGKQGMKTWASRFGLACAAVLLLSLMAGMNGAKAKEPAPRDELSRLFMDRSTPEKVLPAFLEAVNEIAVNFENMEMRRKQSGSWWYPQPDEDARRRMELLKRQALDSLDLSGMPDWSRETGGIEAALMLRDILSRAAVDAQSAPVQLKDGLWVVRGAHLHLARLVAGARAGDVVFTAETLANLPDLHKDLLAIKPLEGFNAYAYFTETPGGLFPPRWAGLVLALPPVFKLSFGTNTVWQWALFGVMLAAAVLLPVLVFRSFGAAASRFLFSALVGAALSLAGQKIAITEGSLTGSAAIFGSMMFSIVFYLACAVFVFLAVEFLSQAIDTRFSSEATSGMGRFFSRIVAVCASLSVIVYGLSAAGLPVVGIVAGLGVGGLAVALAAKTTLENLLASVVLYIDGSVAVGDTIETKEISGVVEQIGMRTTRVRNADGHVTSITNSKFADLTITNLSRRPRDAG